MCIDFNKFSKDMILYKGANDEEIQKLKTAFSYQLPNDFIEFLKFTNGAEGNHIIFWNIDNMIEANNAYSIETNVPGLLLFGSDGGAEAFGFDLREEAIRIVMVPDVSLLWEEAVNLGDSFHEFLERLHGDPKFFML